MKGKKRKDRKREQGNGTAMMEKLHKRGEKGRRG